MPPHYSWRHALHLYSSAFVGDVHFTLFASPLVTMPDTGLPNCRVQLTRYCKQSMVSKRIAALKQLFIMDIGDNIKLMCCCVFATLCLIFGVCFYLFGLNLSVIAVSYACRTFFAWIAKIAHAILKYNEIMPNSLWTKKIRGLCESLGVHCWWGFSACSAFFVNIYK